MPLDASADGVVVRTVAKRAARATGLHPLLARPVLFHLLWTGDLVVAHDRVIDDDTPVLPHGSHPLPAVGDR